MKVDFWTTRPAVGDPWSVADQKIGLENVHEKIDGGTWGETVRLVWFRRCDFTDGQKQQTEANNKNYEIEDPVELVFPINFAFKLGNTSFFTTTAEIQLGIWFKVAWKFLYRQKRCKWQLCVHLPKIELNAAKNGQCGNAESPKNCLISLPTSPKRCWQIYKKGWQIWCQPAATKTRNINKVSRRYAIICQPQTTFRINLFR